MDMYRRSSSVTQQNLTTIKSNSNNSNKRSTIYQYRPQNSLAINKQENKNNIEQESQPLKENVQQNNQKQINDKNRLSDKTNSYKVEVKPIVKNEIKINTKDKKELKQENKIEETHTINEKQVASQIKKQEIQNDKQETKGEKTNEKQVVQQIKQEKQNDKQRQIEDKVNNEKDKREKSVRNTKKSVSENEEIKTLNSQNGKDAETKQPQKRSSRIQSNTQKNQKKEEKAEKEEEQIADKVNNEKDNREKSVRNTKKSESENEEIRISNSQNNKDVETKQPQKRTRRLQSNSQKNLKKEEKAEQEEIVEKEEDDNLMIIEEPQKEQKEKKTKAIRKTREIKKKPYEFKKSKEDNLVRQDLKRKYKDKFRGGVNIAKRNYTKNGKLKQNLKNKFNKDEVKPNAMDNIQIQTDKTNDTNAQFNERANKQNMYLNCLSEALLFTINQIDEEEKEQEFNELDFNDLSDDNLRKVLQVVYGFDDFRSGQLESIKNIINKESTLIIQSTGHGKSLIFQFPTLFVKGIAIVISPLISLMMDQVQHLPKQIAGAAYNSSLSLVEKQRIIQLIKEGKIKILYIAPEVLQSDFSYFFKYLPEISYVCIDEAHCVSEWSHNFRTSYLIINDLIQQKLKCNQIVALTATATLQTQQSMIEKLNISKVIKGTSVKRDNLMISISRDNDKNSAVFKLINSLPIKNTDSIIIYCKYKYQCDTLASFLTYSGITSAAYHSECEDRRKAQIFNDFMKGEIRIVVATIAFGMGIDKSDIRAVIHMNMPKTVENYVQEAGRAGRDGKVSYCHMFLDDEDFYRNCGYVYSDSVDYQMLKQFYEKIKKAIWDIQDKTRTIRKKNNKNGVEEIVFDEELMQSAKKKYCYIELKPVMLELDSKKESLQTLLMKFGQLQNQDDQIFRVFPVGYKNCSIWFLVDQPEEMAKVNDLVKTLLEMCNQTNGCYTFNVCDVCNRLEIEPIELQKKLRELFPKVKYEMKEESLVFQLLRTFEEQEILQVLDSVYKEMKKYEEISLNKIHFIYSIAKMTSYPKIEYMVKNNLFTDTSKALSMNKYFDPYFNHETTSYIKILEDANINLNQVLPYEQILKQNRTQIIEDVNNFLKAEINFKDEDKQEELLKNYRNPKVITRVMQGIPSYSYDYKEWKKNSFWNQYYKFKFDELYEIVEEGISEYMYEYDPVPKRKLKNPQK